MTSHTASTPPDRGEQYFDLSQIFIGREQQLDLFDIYLTRWQRLMSTASPKESVVTEAPSPNNKIQGLVVLLYGEGGFGKSTLLQRYRTIAQQTNYQLTVSRIIDWECVPNASGAISNQQQGKAVDPVKYFELLCKQFVSKLDKRDNDFKHYQRVKRDVEKARKQAKNVIDNLSYNERFAPLRWVAGEGLIAILREIPFLRSPLSNEQVAEKVKGFVGEGTVITVEQVMQLHNRLRDKLGAQYDAYLDPALRLGLALGKDLSGFARSSPLLIFFDTYEEISKGDDFLRIVMGSAGLRVGWVLAGIDDLWDRTYRGPREYGYEEIVVRPDRGLAINFNTSVGTFTLEEVNKYFDLLCQKAPCDPPLPKINKSDTQRILDITKGIPLAVQIAAKLYSDTSKIDSITEKVDGKHEIIDRMVQLYFRHAHGDQAEREKLYALTMLRSVDRPAAVEAALNLTPDQAKNSYRVELTRLQRRYSFIFARKDDPTLHQLVRRFLRLWLLEKNNEPEIVTINERLLRSHADELERLENYRAFPSLKSRLQDDDWVNVYLNLAEQHCWIDPVSGVRFLLPFMLVAAIYRRDSNEDVAWTGAFFFQGKRSLQYRRWWDLAQSLKYETSFGSSSEAAQALVELEKMLQQQQIPFSLPLSQYRYEIEAALWWRLGEAYTDLNKDRALAYYEKALDRLEQELELRKDAAELYFNKAYHADADIDKCIALLNRAIELNPEHTYAYNNRGTAFVKKQEYDKAIENYDQALKLDPQYVYAYSNRGVAYANKHEYDKAIKDYDQALALDSKDAATYYNRGFAHTNMEEFKKAVEDFDQALKLDSQLALRIYISRGLAYAGLQEYDRAIKDYDLALALNPEDATAYLDRGIAYYRKEEYEKAIEDYNKAIELNPQFANAYYNRGIVYDTIEVYKKAVEDYDRYLELCPEDDTVVSRNRGRAYAELQKREERLKVPKIVRTLGPREDIVPNNQGELNSPLDQEGPDVLWMAAWASMKKQRIDVGAIESLEKIANLYPEDYFAYICRAIALGLHDKVRDARKEIEKAVSLKANGWDAYFWKGMLCAYYYSGQSQATLAMEAIEQSLENGLPPVLLTPLYWLEQDRPEFFMRYAKPLLDKYGI